MNSAISVNEVTSTSTARPAGTPSRANWPIWRQSRRLDALPDSGRRGRGLRAQQPEREQRPSPSSPPAWPRRSPPAPIAGRPAPPKVNQIDSGSFSASEASCSQVTSCGLPRLWLSVLNRRNSSAGGSAKASTREVGFDVGAHAPPAPRSSAAAAPGNSRHRHAEHDAPAPHRYSACRTERPTSAVRCAPCSSAQTGSSACSTPISDTKTLMKMAEPTDSAASAPSA